jgi:ketosteroid isomerase-like protein
VSENLDLVRSIYADWERGDFERADWADPEIELVMIDGPDPGSWSGRSAMAQAWGSRLAAYEDYHTRADSYRVLDDESVLVLNHYGGRAKASGLDVDEMQNARGAAVFHFRGGCVVRLVVYFDPARALADLDLEE